MTIGRRFIITSGVLIFLSTALAVVAIVGLNGIRKNVNSLATDSVPGLSDAAAIGVDVYTLRGDYLRDISETDPAALAEVDQDIVLVNARLVKDLKAYDETITRTSITKTSTRLARRLSQSSRAGRRYFP